ncbi:MAG TPA: maleylacetate reductase [Xanthobacteraceae bacterium]|nr:maleylacetate reductase [Xanthobacteraceae bacterium]
MFSPFVYEASPQRVVFGPGAVSRVADEAAKLGVGRALTVATAGSGVRLGQKVAELLGARSAGVHAQAVMHVPRAIAAAGTAAAKDARADGVVAVGGGSAIGLAKAIAHATGLPIIAVPTTYSGSEVTAIFGLSEGDTKTVSRDLRVLPRTIIYDPDLTTGLPPAATAASGMNAIAHCVEALWVPERTPVTSAFAAEALRLFVRQLPRAVADGTDQLARSDCLTASWLAGAALATGTGLHHKLAHVLGGYGLPHAETHAIILPHVTRFNLADAPPIAESLAAALGGRDPAAVLTELLQRLPIPQRLRDVGFERAKIEGAALQIEALGIKEPRAATADDVRTLLMTAF